MFGLHFRQDYARAVLDALNTGKPLPSPADAGWTSKVMQPVAGTGWNRHAKLTLAGILYACIYSQGPPTHEQAGLTQADLQVTHPETREAVEQTLQREIHGGIEYLSTLTFRVMDDKYDGDCEPEVTAVLYLDHKGCLTVRPVRGFKHLDSGTT
jgi:hypothetical protein